MGPCACLVFSCDVGAGLPGLDTLLHNTWSERARQLYTQAVLQDEHWQYAVEGVPFFCTPFDNNAGLLEQLDGSDGLLHTLRDHLLSYGNALLKLPLDAASDEQELHAAACGFVGIVQGRFEDVTLPLGEGVEEGDGVPFGPSASSPAFLIRHYAGTVAYSATAPFRHSQTCGFVSSLWEEACSGSSVGLVRTLLPRASCRAIRSQRLPLLQAYLSSNSGSGSKPGPDVAPQLPISSVLVRGLSVLVPGLSEGCGVCGGGG
jgi:hypothetical protein